MMAYLTYFGVLASLVICAVNLLIAAPDLGYYVSPPALLLVVGGTISLSMICFPPRAIMTLLKTLLRKFTGAFQKDPVDVIREISQIARAARADQEYFRRPSVQVETPFLRDAVEILQRGGVSEERLLSILRKRAETFSSRYGDDLIMLEIMGKFPMGLGILGAVLEIIRQIRLNPGVENGLSMSSLSLAFVPLIYGMLLTNFFFIPLRHKMAKLNQSDSIIRQIVTDGAVLLLKKEHPVLVDDHLKSYLLPMERRKIAET